MKQRYEVMNFRRRALSMLIAMLMLFQSGISFAQETEFLNSSVEENLAVQPASASAGESVQETGGVSDEETSEDAKNVPEEKSEAGSSDGSEAAPVPDAENAPEEQSAAESSDASEAVPAADAENAPEEKSETGSADASEAVPAADAENAQEEKTETGSSDALEAEPAKDAENASEEDISAGSSSTTETEAASSATVIHVSDEEPAADTTAVDESNAVSMMEEGLIPAEKFFSGILTFDGPDYTVTAEIGEDAQFPEDIQMRVEEILPGTDDYKKYLDAMGIVLTENEELGEFSRFFDISFVQTVEEDDEEKEIPFEPAVEISVQVIFHDPIVFDEETDVRAAHFDELTPEIVKAETDSTESAVNEDSAIDTVSFSSNHFPVYGFFQVKKVQKVLTLGGESYNYTVNVSYDDESCSFPLNATLEAREISETDPLYDAYRKQAAQALEADDVRLAGLFDIGIYQEDGEKLSLSGPVNVTITLNNGLEDGIQIVHFKSAPEPVQQPVVQPVIQPTLRSLSNRNALRTQALPEVQIEEKAEENTEETVSVGEAEVLAASVIDEGTAQFTTDSFSVFALAYTVDFAYDVNGKEYEYSLPGGGFITLPQLLEVLGFNEEINGTDLDQFIADIENVEFSSPELVWTGKVEEDTTVGQVKTAHELECEYSAELTAEQIEEINSAAVSAGEWLLISLKAFTSEETLTVTMKDGEVFTILVTDAQITTHFIDAKGDTWEITVTFDDDAGIPDDAELRVNEIMPEDEEYQEYAELTAEAVGTAADTLNYLKLLDISIMNGEDKVIIQAPVNVQIKLIDKDNSEDIEEAEETKVVHFGETETSVIDPELNGTTVLFEAEGFSYYAVTTYGATENLDGKSFAIVQVNTQAAADQATGNNTVYLGRALTTNATDNNSRLSGATVNVEKHESGMNLVSSGTTQIAEWTFESAGGTNTYYIKALDGKYLNLQNNNNRLLLSNNRQALTITAGTGNNAGKVRISDGNSWVQSSVSAAAARTANNSQYFFNGNSNDANYVYLTLCEIEEFDPDQYPIYSGEKISAQQLVDGQKYILYKNIYNDITGQYEDWVIDGNGNPVRAYDQGDSLSLHSEVSPMWVLSILKNADGLPTGYYIFRNEETGLILHPMSDGTLVKEYDSVTSSTTDGVSLKGREGGAYTSTIEYWDGSAMAYYGYEFTTDGEVKLSSGTGDHSQAFSFAAEPASQDGLHTVATVDSSSNGVNIHMFNYSNRSTIANVTGSDSYGVGVLPAQHIKAVLNNGYPEFTNGNNGSTLFNPSSNYHQGTGNHLFLASVYNSTDYYEYSAFNNFAHYNTSNGTFTVYQETGTPSTTSSNFYYRRGNFFPYNSLNTNNSAQNIYTGDGSLIDYENPNYGSKLYGLAGEVDFYFGMTMDFSFLMPKDGYNNGSPLIYEFNGDDDLWVFIDDVLILDIGGVHDAFPGTINFATGEITGGNGGAGRARTIKECFKKAGRFPDGSTWDDSRVDEYFSDNTFVNYGSHKFNMFYMEHGAGASNLFVRFNLPVIEKGKVTVEKQLANTSQVDYANVAFAYQAFVKKNGTDESLTSAVYEGTDTPISFYNGVKFPGKDKAYDNVFYLKPGEAAVFSNMIEDELYYVQELGIKEEYYDKILVNDVEIVGEQVIVADGIYKSSEATPRNRARVTFTNSCDDRNSNELQITKRLAPGSTDNGDTFEFRVMLENAKGELSAYYQGTYYIRDDQGTYYRYEGGKLVQNGQTPYACTAGNYGTIAQIPPGYTIVIKDLLAGTDFYVDEIRVRPNGTTSDVLIKNSDWTLVSRVVSEFDPAEITNASIYDYESDKTITGSALGRIAWNKDAKVVFTNKLASVDIQLKKVKEDGTTIISGSEFKLSKYSENGSWVELVNDIKPLDQALDLGELVLGRYCLTEKKAPDGYLALKEAVFFEVYKDAGGSYKARLTDATGAAVDNPTEMATIQDDTPTTEGAVTTYTITVKNTPGVVLPATGGQGTMLYTVSGLMLVLLAGVLLIGRKRKYNR